MSHSVIAVGIDESEISRCALAWAAKEALRRGSSLHVITTWSWPTDMGPAGLAPIDGEALEASAQQIQQDCVDVVLTGDLAGIALERSVVCRQPADALVEASKDADLVVVGSHGRSAIGSLFFGSVSQLLIKHSHCPVVVLPPSMTGVDPAELDDA